MEVLVQGYVREIEQLKYVIFLKLLQMTIHFLWNLKIDEVFKLLHHLKLDDAKTIL